MKEHLKQELLTKYPEWHHNPLRLSIDEIEAPYSVLGHFFECYTLPQIRACLQELVYDSLRAEDSDAASHVTTHEDIEKLVEAAWVILKQNSNEPDPKTQDSVNDNQIKEVEENVQLAGSYRIIHDFFESFTLPFARYYLLSAIKAAEDLSIWDKRAPTDLLHFFDMLKSLISAVYSIEKKGTKIKHIVLSKPTGSPDVTQYHLYCGPYDQLEAWDFFPRCLSAKEYCDPYKALQKFTKWHSKQEWQMTLRYILSYALGNSSLSELGVNLELVRISELLQKMLEACHLIYVRTAVQPQKP